MKKLFPLFFIFIFAAPASAQHCYWGMTFDGNLGSHADNSFGLGMDIQARIRDSKWYLNWHYSAGSTNEMDSYARGSALWTMYADPDYWNLKHVDKPLAALVGLAIFPILCPTGVTNYFYNSLSDKVRIGFYFNPLQLDWWDKLKTPVLSWSVQSGFRFHYNYNDRNTVFLDLGVTRTNNLNDYPRASDLNQFLFSFSVGVEHMYADKDYVPRNSW